MDSSASTTNDESSVLLHEKDDYPASIVDPFLVEALQNPRHRLTILRMALDIQKFLQSSDVEKFEFQHFPTSYLRLAAHRVAQHYGLQTMVQDNTIDGQGTKIVVRKTSGDRCSAMHLSDIPIRQFDSKKHDDNVKIFLRPKPLNASNETSKQGMKCNTVRTVEERKEDYDRARARIFSSPTNSELEDKISHIPIEGKILGKTDSERSIGIRDVGIPSPVATFKDRDKDLTDPDYDRRSYKRSVQTMPTAQFVSWMPLGMQNFHSPFVLYGVSPRMAYHQRPYVALGVPMDVVHMHCPPSTMMHAQSMFQVPCSQQQPLSFGYSQKYWLKAHHI